MRINIIFKKYIFLFGLPLLVIGCKSKQNESTNQQMNNTPLELSKSDQKLGIGLIHMNLNTAIPLYKSKNDSIAYDTLGFKLIEKGKEKGKLQFTTNILKERLKPYALEQGDSEAQGKEHYQMGLFRFSPVLAFTVLDRDKDGATIVMNEESRETSYIRLLKENDLNKHDKKEISYFDPNFVDTQNPNWYFYEIWEEALKRAFYITLPEGTKFYDAPNKNLINITLGDNPQVESFENEWVQIKGKDDSGKSTKAWVRWKDKDKLLIYYQLHGGYE